MTPALELNITGAPAPVVKTIAELEVFYLLEKISDGDASMMVIDSRTSAWVEKGIIPGTMNIPWDTLNIGKSDPAVVQEILESQLGAKRWDDFWNSDNFMTMVLFGHQTEEAIKSRDVISLNRVVHIH